MIHLSVADLEARLALRVPQVYRDWLASRPESEAASRGYDPTNLCAYNLDLRDKWLDGDWRQESNGRLFITGDGCGNYFFAEGETATGLRLLAHDPPGIEECRGLMLVDLLDRQPMEPYRISYRPLFPGFVVICRTQIPAESIFDPITIPEFLAVMQDFPQIQPVLREQVNPFTQEKIVYRERRLFQVDLGDVRFKLWLFKGRTLSIPEAALPFAQRLAAALGAQVLRATP